MNLNFLNYRLEVSLATDDGISTQKDVQQFINSCNITLQKEVSLKECLPKIPEIFCIARKNHTISPAFYKSVLILASYLYKRISRNQRKTTAKQ